jgi:hypothetical protein
MLVFLYQAEGYDEAPLYCEGGARKVCDDRVQYSPCAAAGCGPAAVRCHGQPVERQITAHVGPGWPIAPTAAAFADSVPGDVRASPIKASRSG